MPAFKRVAASTARFLFCAIPGLALMLFVGPICLLTAKFDSSAHPILLAIGGVLAIAAGAPLILFGTNRWGRWGYLLPFFSVPVVIMAYDDRPVMLLTLAIPFVVAALVHLYYKRRYGS